MSKIKIRCSQCGKSFKSTNPKQQICPECEEKARRERAAKSKGLPTANAPALPPRRGAPPKPAAQPTVISAQSKQHWLDQQQGVKIASPEPSESARPPRLDIAEHRGRPAQPAVGSAIPPGEKTRSTGLPTQKQAPMGKRLDQRDLGMTGSRQVDLKTARPPLYGQKAAGDKAAKDGKRVGTVTKTKREPRLPTPPFMPTPEQIAAIEQRYLELAQTGEFDGIRTQISKELTLPKSAVKQVVQALRVRQGIPSWWDLQSYHGSPEDLERIRSAYQPFLPLPPIGIHKQIAGLLNLPPGTVYQAIKTIRAEMNLPQYNPPTDHDVPAAPTGASETSGNPSQLAAHED